MKMIWAALSLLGLALLVLNVWGTMRIWRSGLYERGQLRAQTALIWIVPGSVLAVLYVLKGDRPSKSVGDPTATNSSVPNANVNVGAGGIGAP